MAKSILAFSLVVTAAASSCFTKSTAGVHENLECNSLLLGLRVTYNVPQQCVNQTCGLITDLHGYSMNAAVEDFNTNMRELGEKNGYIVIQPSAPGGNWLDTTGAHKRAVLAMVNEALAVEGWKIDRNKVHLMGFSQGAMVTSSFICSHPDLFASFVVMEAANGGQEVLTCLKKGSPQPPVLLQNGLNDLSSRYGVWEASFPHIRESWGLSDGVKIAGDGKTWDRIRNIGSTGVPFEFLNYTYVADYFLKGHCFPGSKHLHKTDVPGQVLPFGCPGLKEQAQGQKAGYFIGEEAMQFFLDHPKSSEIIV